MRITPRSHAARSRGPSAALLAVLGAALAFALLPAAAFAASQASYTSTNSDIDGGGHCGNGSNPDPVNCNSYDGKEFVWMNGGPATAYEGDGDYFFAVLAPGGQANPNDDSDKLLSTDAYTNRTFTSTGGTITTTGDHELANNKLRLVPYADTPNNGGVYVMAICSLKDGYPAKPSSCKYDAFKVESGDECTEDCGPVPPAADLVVTKDANPTFTRTYPWTVVKSVVGATQQNKLNGTATFNYSITATKGTGVDSGWTVSGLISVFNPNSADVTGVDVTDDIQDETADSCTVTDGLDATIPALASQDFAYSCTYSSAPAGFDQTNRATAEWGTQVLSDGSTLTGNSAEFDFAYKWDNGDAGNPTKVDDCIDVTDTPQGGTATSLGQTCDTTTYPVSHTWPVPARQCAEYTNTADLVATASTGSSTATVKVCRVPPNTGARTIGFWQNPNGQGIITAGAYTIVDGAKVCNVGTWLRSLAPFQDLGAKATCKEVAAYVTKIIKAANSSGASMNAMLKAQMLATALDVYFSDPALGGNKLLAPAPIGGVKIDLKNVCANPSTCTNYIDASAAFDGNESGTVSELLTWAAQKSNAGGSVWYANNKATQELAKDVFDAINNEVAYQAP